MDQRKMELLVVLLYNYYYSSLQIKDTLYSY